MQSAPAPSGVRGCSVVPRAQYPPAERVQATSVPGRPSGLDGQQERLAGLRRGEVVGV
jgi:hypothetical protein